VGPRLVNAFKSEQLTVRKKHSPFSSDYFLNNYPVSKVSYGQYLGLVLPLHVIVAGINIFQLYIIYH